MITLVIKSVLMLGCLFGFQVSFDNYEDSAQGGSTLEGVKSKFPLVERRLNILLLHCSFIVFSITTISSIWGELTCRSINPALEVFILLWGAVLFFCNGTAVLEFWRGLDQIKPNDELENLQNKGQLSGQVGMGVGCLMFFIAVLYGIDCKLRSDDRCPY